MKLVMDLPKVELGYSNDDRFTPYFDDISKYTHDYENNIIYIDTVYKPEKDSFSLKLDKYLMKLSFKQYLGMPQLEQIDNYVEKYHVEYDGYWLFEVKSGECVTWRHKFYVEWQER